MRSGGGGGWGYVTQYACRVVRRSMRVDGAAQWWGLVTHEESSLPNGEERGGVRGRWRGGSSALFIERLRNWQKKAEKRKDHDI